MTAAVFIRHKISKAKNRTRKFSYFMCLFFCFLFCLPFGSAFGYVVPGPKVLQLWVAQRGEFPVPVEIPLIWNYRSGKLYASTPGRHALIFDDGEVILESPFGSRDPFTPLWRAIDLFVVPLAADLDVSLAGAGINLKKSGYVRTDRSKDGVSYAVGAKGEGESADAQIWFSRAPLWPCGVKLPGFSSLEIGPVGSNGWPDWFLFGDDNLIQLSGAPAPALSDPHWAATESDSTIPGDGPFSDWRKAFDDLAR